MPALVHDGFVLYETTAITRYIDDAFGDTALQPADPRERARMNQIVAVADFTATGRWSGRYFRIASSGRPKAGQATRRRSQRASRKSARVLAALDDLAAGGPFLVGDTLSLADLHFGAMIAYFAMAQEGRSELRRHAKLAEWWRPSTWPSLVKSDPGLPAP